MECDGRDYEGITCEEIAWDDFFRPTERQRDRTWLYRGAACAEGQRSLASSFERAAESWRIPSEDWPAVELELLREFRRKASGFLHLTVDPEPDDYSLLALMRHHGAPTRLLDWTYSRFVAAYFALEGLLKHGPHASAVIWAIRAQWIEEESMKDFSGRQWQAIRLSKPRSLNFLFRDSKEARPSVIEANPFYLNERLAIQQGIFLCPRDISRTFMDNLKGLSGWERNVKRFCLRIETDEVGLVFDELHSMNIDRTTLFPGLDGFAASLGYRMRFFYELNKRREERLETPDDPFAEE